MQKKVEAPALAIKQKGCQPKLPTCGTNAEETVGAESGAGGNQSNAIIFIFNSEG